MKKIIFIIISVISVSSLYAQSLIVYSPDRIREYEDFYIRIDKNVSFTINISSRCLTIQRYINITHSDPTYHTGSDTGTLFFDNKCFEKQNIEIILNSSNGSQEKLKYQITPRPEERINMGC